jgi:hypothetical protein
MRKRAKAAALSLSLGFGALCQVHAQAANGNDTVSDINLAGAGSILLSQAPKQPPYQTGFSAPQTSSSQVQNVPGTWVTDPNTGLGKFVPAASTQAPGAGPSATPTPAASATNAPPPPPGKGPVGKGAASATGAQKTTSTTYTIAESGKPGNVSKNSNWQKFENYITLTKQGQEQLPLTLTVHNGDDSPPFSQLRLTLSGSPIGSEKNFKDHVLTMSVTGALGAGDNQLVIQALGPVGAKITWRVTAPRPVAKKVNPDEAAPGKSITITGEGFSTSAAIDQVMIGDKQAPVTQATATSLTATVPEGAASGEQPLSVKVAGREAKPPLKIKIAGAPEVSGVNVLSSNPGEPLTITGKGFSANASENQVTIGGVQAQITSCSTSSISCIIPEGIGNPSYNNPVVVTTNKVASKGSVTIDIQRRVIYNDGGPAMYK